MDTLNVAAGALYSMFECLRRQSGMLKMRIGALRMRRGLLSLPDDVLADILEYAASNPDRRFHEAKSATFATEAALKLSHVCQRFRIVIMCVSGLWTSVYNGMDFGLVSALCDRLTEPTADIFLGAPFRRSRTNSIQFIRTVVARCAHWRRFDHGQDFQKNYVKNPWHSSATKEELQELARITHQLRVPFLTELAIHYPRIIGQDVQDAFHYYSTWTAPRLRSFTMGNSIPVLFAASATLTYFKVALNCRIIPSIDQRLIQLIQFLLSCPVLKTFVMNLNCLELPVKCSFGKCVEFPSVDTLDFDLQGCNGSSIKKFLNAARFPNTSAMKLDISTFNNKACALDQRPQRGTPEICCLPASQTTGA